MPRRRPTRVTLRGWWRSLPFLASGFGLMFLFAWLETERLNNEYRAQDLAEEIIEVNASIAKLQEQRYHLKRMERMEQEAPSLFLREANPGQIVIIQGEEFDAPLPSRSQTAAREEKVATRSVVFRLVAADHGGVDMTLQHEVAKRQPQE